MTVLTVLIGFLLPYCHPESGIFKEFAEFRYVFWYALNKPRAGDRAHVTQGRFLHGLLRVAVAARP